MEVNPIPDRSERLMVLLKGISDFLHDIAVQTWQEYGLTPPAAILLFHIHRNPGATVSGLSRTAGLAKSHVSKTVETLVAGGFIERLKDPRDQRLVRLHATAKAETQFQEMWTETRMRLYRAVEALGDERLMEITAGLEDLMTTIEKDGQYRWSPGPRHGKRGEVDQ